MGKDTKFAYSTSNWDNLKAWFPLIFDMLRFKSTVHSKRRRGDLDKEKEECEEESVEKNISWGEWSKKKGYVIGGKFDSMIMWMLMGQVRMRMRIVRERKRGY